MNFKAFADDVFVGFYAGMTKDGSAIKTLGAIIDTCGLTEIASTISAFLGS